MFDELRDSCQTILYTPFCRPEEDGQAYNVDNRLRREEVPRNYIPAITPMERFDIPSSTTCSWDHCIA